MLEQSIQTRIKHPCPMTKKNHINNKQQGWLYGASILNTSHFILTEIEITTLIESDRAEENYLHNPLRPSACFTVCPNISIMTNKPETARRCHKLDLFTHSYMQI